MMTTDHRPTLERLAARVAIFRESERLGLERTTDDAHDALNTAADLLEACGVPLPDPNTGATAEAAWA